MGRPPKKPQGPFPNGLRVARKKRGISGVQLATRMNTDRSSLYRKETGEYELTLREAQEYADAIGADVSEILPGALDRMVPVVGRIGAGAQVLPFDDHPMGEGLYKVPCPPNLDPATHVAVEVVGESMPPLDPGWVLFYSRVHDLPPSALINRLCACKVANDGPLYVKQLRRGPTPGKYNLISSAAPHVMEDLELEWAALIAGARPGLSDPSDK